MNIRISFRSFLLFAVLIIAFVFAALSYFDWIIDDLYIYFRYAGNFISGKGIVFNSGEFVEGFSSFTWFLYLSLCAALQFPLESAAKYSSLVFAVINALLAFRIAGRVMDGRFAIIAPILMLFNAPYMIWAISGFEIMLCIFLMLVSVYIALYRNGQASLRFLSVVLFLITFTRPEGILAAASIFIFLFYYRNLRDHLKVPLVIYSILLILFLGFRYFYFGDLLPNTYYAKIGHELIGSYELRSYKNGIVYFIFFLRSNVQFIPAVLFSVFVLIKLRYKQDLLLLTMLFISQLIFIVFSGGDWMVQYRFAVTAIPFLSLLSLGLLREISRKEFASVITAVILCLIAAASLKFNDYSVIEREITLWNNLKIIAPSMNEVIPEGSLAASGACGIMPFYMKNVNFIDMVGLTNREIAKNGYRSGMWFERSLPSYVYSLNPQWLIMWKKSSNGGEYLFRNAAPVYDEMSKDPAFGNYELSKTYDVLHDVKIEFYKRKGG
jgi:hypothetical protein